MQINVFDLMYTYCLILRWEIVFTSDIVYFGFTFLVYKFEKEKKVFKKRERDLIPVKILNFCVIQIKSLFSLVNTSIIII